MLLAAAPFLHTLWFGFVFDDDHLIVQNTFIREPWSPVRAFAHHFWYGGPFFSLYYRPMVSASLALNGRLSGWDPVGFHLVNLLLHALNTTLVLSLCRRLGQPLGAAALAAALFAVHPVAAWPVASIVARVDLLAATFVLLAWRAFAGPGTTGRRASRPVIQAAAVGGWFLLALLAKESAVAFLVVPLLALRPHRDDAPRPRRAVVGSFVAVLAALVIAVLMRVAAGVPLTPGRHGVDPVVNPLYWLPQPARLWAAIELSGRYLGYLLLPMRLGDPHRYVAGAAAPTGPDGGAILAAAFLVACGVACVTLWIRRDRLGLFLAFTLASFLPASNLLVLISSLYAQNFLYLPLIGVSLAVGEVARRITLASRRRLEGRRAAVVALPAALGALLLMGFAAHREAAIWRDPESLFQAWSERYPGFALAYDGLGQHRLRHGDPAGAVAPLRQLVKLNDQYADGRFNLAVALLESSQQPDDLEEALREVRAALALAPEFPQARLAESRILRTLQRPGEAETAAREALRLVPGLLPARLELAESLFAQERFAEAAVEFGALAAASPLSAEARSPLVVALIRAGNMQEARQEAERARRDFPDAAWFDFCLARIEALAGNAERVQELLGASVARDPATVEWIGRVHEFDRLRADGALDRLVGAEPGAAAAGSLPASHPGG